MVALNAVSWRPVSILYERKQEPRKISLSSTICLPKISSSVNFNVNPQTPPDSFSRRFQKGLVLFSSSFNTGFAKALTYEEALQQSTSTSSSEDFDAGGRLVGFVTENPAIIAGGALVLAVPLIFSQIFKKPKPWGFESAKNAYANLGEDENSQLIDIREPVELRQVGTPDIRGLGKKPVSIVYRGEGKPGFLKKLALKFKDPENTTLFILDKFDGNSELVAELVTMNGFKAAYGIIDGVEGPRGWVGSGLPWTPPRKALSLDLINVTEAINEVIGEGSGGLSITIGIAAATGFGLLAFTEIETVLQLLGSAALVQLVSKKLLFAEDRKVTLKQADEFLSTKIAPKELVAEIQQIGKALLPSPVNGKALPAPAEANSQPATTNIDNPNKAEAAAETKVEATATPAPEINSVPKTEVKAESHSRVSKALSPFPCYPDFKPPTSPTPSKP